MMTARKLLQIVPNAKKIHSLMNKKGLNTHQLSKISGVPSSVLYTSFNHNSCAHPKNLLKIAKALNVEVSTIAKVVERPALNVGEYKTSVTIDKEALCRLVAAQDCSAHELSFAAGLGHSTISNLLAMSDGAKMRLSTAKRIAEVLGVDVKDITKTDEEIKRPDPDEKVQINTQMFFEYLLDDEKLWAQVPQAMNEIYYTKKTSRANAEKIALITDLPLRDILFNDEDNDEDSQ